jgi:hypothetical protein
VPRQDGDTKLKAMTKKKKSRNLNSRYPFADGHPQQETHEMCQRSKLRVPELMGSPPVCPPEYNTRTAAKCDTYGKFILTLFHPWDLITHTPTSDVSEYSWIGFCAFLVELGKENGLWKNRSTLQIIRNISIGVRSAPNERRISCHYRGRGTRLWTDKDVDSDDEDPDAEIVGEDGRYHDTEKEEKDDQDQAEALLALINAFNATRQADKTEGAIKYLKGQNSNMNDLLSKRITDAASALVIAQGLENDIQDELSQEQQQGEEKGSKQDAEGVEKAKEEAAYMAKRGIRAAARSIVPCDPNLKATLESCTAEFKRINLEGKAKEGGQNVNVDNDDENYPDDIDADAMAASWVLRRAADEESNQRTATEIFDARRLSDQQLTIVKSIIAAIDSNEQLLICVMNGPGVGKTYALQTVDMVLNSRKGVGDVAVISNGLSNFATTGAAASVFGYGARTVHSGVGISPNSARNSDGSLNPLSKQKLAVYQKFLEGKRAAVIDEVSMLTVTGLGDFDTRLRQIKNEPNKLFGGMTVILAGDFQQLPPAVGTPIYSGVIRAYSTGRVSAPELKPITLFERESRLIFQKFQIKYLTIFKRATDKVLMGHLASLRDLTITNPIQDPLIRQLKDLTITAEELSGAWKDAITCVQSNKERHQINHTMVCLRAKELQDVLVCWENLITSPIGIPAVMEADIRDSHKGELYGFFLKDAPAIVCMNISPVLQVANGSAVTLDSLVILDEDDRTIALDLIRNAPLGSVVMLPKRPDYVVVKMANKIFDSVANNQKLNIQRIYSDSMLGSADDYLVAIPFTSDPWNKNKVVYGAGDSTSVVKFDKFMFDLGYCLTTYKLQGATLQYLLIDLNQRPVGLNSMDLRSLYVILSRVCEMNRIRIMPFRPHPSKTNINNINYLDYLKGLSQCAELAVWKDCIDPVTFKFDPSRYRYRDASKQPNKKARTSSGRGRGGDGRGRGRGRGKK